MPAAKMVTQQGARCLFLFRTRESPDYISNKRSIISAHINLKPCHSPPLEPFAKIVNGLALRFDQYKSS
jgi:hypothetical protein